MTDKRLERRIKRNLFNVALSALDEERHGPMRKELRSQAIQICIVNATSPEQRELLRQEILRTDPKKLSNRIRRVRDWVLLKCLIVAAKLGQLKRLGQKD